MCTSSRLRTLGPLTRHVSVLGLAVLVAGVLAVGACDRFPRDNPLDPEGSGVLIVERGDSDLAIADLNSVAPANNENGAVEAGETVFVTVPLEVRSAPTGLTGTITAEVDEDASDEVMDCVIAVTTQGMIGSQLLVALPATDSRPQPLLAGPVRVVIASDCPVDTDIDLVLLLNVTQTGESYTLPFSFTIAEAGPGPTLSSVEVADPSRGSAVALGNGDGRLDPGEIVILLPTLENATPALLPGLTARVKSGGRECFDSVQINGVTGGMTTFGNLLPGQRATPADLLTAEVAASCEDGDDASLEFEVSDAAGRTWTLPFTQVIGAAPEATDNDAGM